MHYTAIHYSRYLITVAYCYNIAIQIYTLFEGRLLSQSIRSGKDVLYSYSIFKISHYGRLLICSIRPVTETYNIAIKIYTLSEG
ncbi:hypothetical protein GIB67_017751, partial [Kingdonia uniflora]